MRRSSIDRVAVWTYAGFTTEVKDARCFPTDALFYSNPGYPSYTFGGHEIATQATLEARW